MKKLIFFFIFALLSSTVMAMQQPFITKKSLSCPACGQHCSSRSNLNTHTRSQHSPGHTDRTCTQCNKAFASHGRLMYHVSRIHNRQEAPYACTKCTKKYKNRASFNTHQALHEHTVFIQAASALAALTNHQTNNEMPETSDLNTLGLLPETPQPTTSNALALIEHNHNSAFKPYKR